MQKENSVTKGQNIAAETNALCHQLTCSLKAFRAQLLKDQVDRPVHRSFNTGQVLLISEINQHFRGSGQEYVTMYMGHLIYHQIDTSDSRGNVTAGSRVTLGLTCPRLGTHG